MTVGITELPPEGMQLGGVALAGDADRGTKTTEGLSLLFTTAGITVQGPQPQIERLLVWSGLDSASCREKVDLPDGRNAAVMELTSGGQSIRFLLPMDAVTPGQAAYLDQALPAWLARYKGTAAARRAAARAGVARRRPLRCPTGEPPSGGLAASGASRRDGIGTPTAIPRLRRARNGRPPPVAPAAAAAAAAGGIAAAASSQQRDDAGHAGLGVGDAGGDRSGQPDGVRVARPALTLRSDPPGLRAPIRSAPSFVARSGAGMLPPSGPPPALGTASARSPATTGRGGGCECPSGQRRRVGHADRSAGRAHRLGEPAVDRGVGRRGRPRPRRCADLAEEPSPAARPKPPTPDFFAPMQPPAEPPVDPAPLKLAAPLPPPPPESAEAPGGRGPVIWKPPIDPATGEPAWDQSPEGLKSPPKKRRSWRRGAKEDAAVAAGGGCRCHRCRGRRRSHRCGASAPATVAPDAGAGSFAGTLPPITPAPGVETPVGAPPPRSNRTLVTVLVVVLVVVIGGIAYFAVKRSQQHHHDHRWRRRRWPVADGGRHRPGHLDQPAV